MRKMPWWLLGLGVVVVLAGLPEVAPAKAHATGATPGTINAPFASTSIWRRAVPAGATLHALNGAIATTSPSSSWSAGLDLVTVCKTSPSGKLVNVERSSGWSLPARSTSTGEVQYQRRLAATACTDVSWNPVGNGLFVLYDAASGTADLGVGAWRVKGGPLLNGAPDGTRAHHLDVIAGDGTTGYGRASGLPALGGLLRSGEMRGGIKHAVAINLPNRLLSASRHFTWPASSADASAGITYLGSDPALTMGSLLAIPPEVKVAKLSWHTKEGKNLALAAQRYGWYVVDAIGGGDQLQLGMETGAARANLGLSIDAAGHQQVDAAKVDMVGLNADLNAIVGLLVVVEQAQP